MSSMNPAITFREKSLYTSNYFFGTGLENRRFVDLYSKVHKTRELVGKSLHVLFKFLMENFLITPKFSKTFCLLLVFGFQIWVVKEHLIQVIQK